MRRSQHSAKATAPPRQYPSISAIVGLSRFSSLAHTPASRALAARTAAASACRRSNSEMSAPELKALPPAPEMTTTRTARSSAKSSRIRSRRSHIAIEIALSRAGLLRTMRATAPSLRKITCSLSMLAVFSGLGVTTARILQLVRRSRHRLRLRHAR